MTDIATGKTLPTPLSQKEVQEALSTLVKSYQYRMSQISMMLCIPEPTLRSWQSGTRNPEPDSPVHARLPKLLSRLASEGRLNPAFVSLG